MPSSPLAVGRALGLRRAALITLLYAATGRLSLELSIPPGYSTPIWPPAGIALAAALLYGRRALVPVFLGAWMLVSGTLLAAWGPGLLPFGVGAWVGLGVALQAAWGAWLVRRMVGFPSGLTRGREVLLFLLASGPLASLVSASWSLPVTLASGLVPASEAFFSWLTWYCGDAIGALVVTPIALVWTAEPREVWRRRAGTVVLPMTGVFVACTLVFFLLSRRDQRQIEQSLHQEGVAVCHALETELLSTRGALHALQSYVSSLPALDRNRFERFARDLVEHHPEIRALEWVPRVTPEERTAFEAAARAEGREGFTIRALPGTPADEGTPQKAHFPVLYVEPVVGNESALGLDLGSCPERRALLELATAHGVVAASAPMQLVQGPGDGVLIALPVGEGAAQRGYVLAVLTLDDLLMAATGGTSRRIVSSLHDVTGPDEQLISQPESVAPRALAWFEPLEFGGRYWELRLAVPHATLTARPAWTAWLVLAGGMLLTSALGGLLLIVTGHAITVESLAHERALELHRKDQEAERMQDHLRHSQKLEVVGRLAGGVAHDINNLLTVIQGYGELLRAELGSQPSTRTALAEIERATERAARLVQRLLAFARKQVLHPRPLSLGELLESLRGTLLPLLGERVTLRIVDGAHGIVLADAGQLEQVVMNLAVNARDALLPAGGELRVEVADVQVLIGEAPQGLAPGAYVRLSVIDSGKGMPPEVLERIFEPFYTTKKEGTGLGLATVYGIVQQSGGAVTAESTPGRGTTFRVFLPRVEEDVLVPVERRPVHGEGARGVVLVIEDEEALRTLLCSYLTDCGHEVLTAEGSRRAVQLARQHHAPIDLILTDVVMPELSGPEVVRLVRECHPESDVLYMSGYSEDTAGSTDFEALGASCLQKPFALDELARQVEERVGRRKAALTAV